MKKLEKFPPLQNRNEYSFGYDGPMTLAQLDAWLGGLEQGVAVPGALRWLADSYRAAIAAGIEATEVYPRGHAYEGALKASCEPERLEDIDALCEKATR